MAVLAQRKGEIQVYIYIGMHSYIGVLFTRNQYMLYFIPWCLQVDRYSKHVNTVYNFLWIVQATEMSDEEGYHDNERGRRV